MENAAKTHRVEETMSLNQWQSKVLTKLIPSLRRNYAAQIRSIVFEPGKLECCINISSPAYDGVVTVRDRKVVLNWLRQINSTRPENE
jgi:hypothetical protein